jgi:Xaa-Pro aminopeptidase
MKPSPLPATLFIRNREKLMGMMEPGALALAGSNSRKLRNGDQYYPYRQHSDFFYLTGINQEESILLLFPGSGDPAQREILFLKRATLKSILWSGPGITDAEAAERSGIRQIRALEELEQYMNRFFPISATLYISGEVPTTKIYEGFPDLSVTPLSPLLLKLRTVKEPEELEAIRSACAITRSAFMRILSKIRPGVWEYEIEAEIIAEFIGRGANGHAYEPIVASGENSLVLHYNANRDQCMEGELLLLDFGAEVNNYASDCSRTIPVSGRFSPRQREVYNAVVRVLKKARELMVPGVLMADFHQQVGELWQEEHLLLGLYSLQEAKARAQEEPLWKDYFMHGTSHSMGLDVHDPCDRSVPFRAGMVVTCEPAIYIREEGFGIRLENDVLITDTGPLDLMEDIPLDAEEIESIIHSRS